MSQTLLTFGNVPQPPADQARATIIPVPLEATVSWGEGTGLGPAAIMNASANMELYDEILGQETYRLGILTRSAVDVTGALSAVLERVQAAVAAELIAGRLPVLLGGEHSLTLGALRALVAKHGPGFTVLSLDAHLDLREEYEGEPLSHACVMKRALDLGLMVRHLGCRSCSVEEAALVRARGLKPMWAHQVHTDPAWLEKSLDGVEGPVYITLDVDGFDPAVVAATGTPEPGGLFWPQVAAWLAEVCRRHPVLGVDVVELAPMRAHPASDFTCARLAYRAIGLALKERD
ncbi:MAG: agmatinase [Thermodesulfobacteriota bacterium]